jgi:hypothetical protein
MSGPWIRALFAAVLALVAVGAARAQEVIDRIVARVENDVILLSDLRALGRYQEFVQGQSESDAQLLDRLIDQWIVRTEADVAHFPQPSEAEIERGLERVKRSFSSPQEYEERKNKCGLDDAEIRKMTASQLYLSHYLDSRFRPSVQVDEKQIEEFYQSGVVPRAKARGQEPPTLEAARDLILEALVQEGINQQADRWLKESRARLHVEKLLDEGAK